MNLQENIQRIQEVMGIYEVRDKFYEFLRKDNPNIPPYIIMDVFYKPLKYHPEFMIPGTDDNDFYNNILKKFKWELKKDFPITMDIFDKYTQDSLKQRIENLSKGIDADWIPKDMERHQKQKELMSSRGLSTEPIVLQEADEPGTYNLWEGWHRTIQAFIKYPDGFIYPNVYIASM